MKIRTSFALAKTVVIGPSCRINRLYMVLKKFPSGIFFDGSACHCICNMTRNVQHGICGNTKHTAISI